MILLNKEKCAYRPVKRELQFQIRFVYVVVVLPRDRRKCAMKGCDMFQ